MTDTEKRKRCQQPNEGDTTPLNATRFTMSSHTPVNFERDSERIHAPTPLQPTPDAAPFVPDDYAHAMQELADMRASWDESLARITGEDTDDIEFNRFLQSL